MAFVSFTEFLAMGGHGLYVWCAYGVFAVLVLCLLIRPLVLQKKLLKDLNSQMQREQTRSQIRSQEDR